MDEPTAAPQAEQYDIFLCTRELPDALTPETAALRQLSSALAGSGYRVFFPSALPRELPDEQRAERIVQALKDSRVMVAAGVGEEGVADPVARKLWSAFRQLAGEDSQRRFFACFRDVAAESLPAELSGTEPLDMSGLDFLLTLKERLAPAFPAPPDPFAPGEEESAPAPEEAEPVPAPAQAKKPFPWKWLVLAAVILAVVVILLVKRH